MNGYQGSDWFKSGVHLKYVAQDDRQQLVSQAAQQISDCSRQLQLAYDGGLALFSNFTGTDAQVARAQETLAAITGVRQALHDLHKRLAPSLTHATSDTRLDYIPSGTQHQDVDGLAVLKAKEEQLQVEVNRCRSLTAENDLLHKQLQALRASESPSRSTSPSGSIRAGQHSQDWTRSSSQDLPAADGNDQNVTLDNVKSLMHAGSWLQMLRAKLAGPGDMRQSRQTSTDLDETASLPGTRDQEEETWQEPMRRSQSDQLHDRDIYRRPTRRGGELVRASQSACKSQHTLTHPQPAPESVVGTQFAAGIWSDAVASPDDRDRRRRTNVFMEEVEPRELPATDVAPVSHFLTPELAARSALFRSRS